VSATQTSQNPTMPNDLCATNFSSVGLAAR
jgi:hypothetical protein